MHPIGAGNIASGKKTVVLVAVFLCKKKQSTFTLPHRHGFCGNVSFSQKNNQPVALVELSLCVGVGVGGWGGMKANGVRCIVCRAWPHPHHLLVDCGIFLWGEGQGRPHKATATVAKLIVVLFAPRSMPVNCGFVVFVARQQNATATMAAASCVFFAPIMPLIVLLFHFIFTPLVIWLKWVPCSAQPLVNFLGYCAPR